MTTHVIIGQPTTTEAIWHPAYNVVIERQIWGSVLAFQMLHRVLDHNPWTMHRLWTSIHKVDLASIARRERITRHDLKARLEETIAVAVIPEVLHLGMTSADVVENAYLVRMAMTCDVLGLEWRSWLPLRGIRGPVGTQQDMLDLLGSQELCDRLDEWVSDWFGFERVAGSVGQVMTRSTDLEWATRLVAHIQPSGSDAILANGYLAMIGGYSGDTWNEGDVSTSVVRRVALPGLAAVLESSQEKG